MDEINRYCETPLATAILANNSDMVRYLLESGANPNCAECPFGILHVAVSSGRANLCLLLIAYGAKVDEINGIGETPLVTAILANNSDMVRYLLESEANPNCAECPFGILRVAVSSGRANLCLLLIAYGAKVDEINGIGETPLVTAILANNSDMVRYLLESGANPNCAECPFGILRVAVSSGRANLCLLLIAYGAKVDEINGIGETPLVTAILANNSDMVRYLLESGANPNCAECPFGILRVAVSSGRANLCLLLIAYGAKVDEINGIGETPLVTAILANNSDMVRYLLESGANPNCAECPFGILRVAVSSGRANLCLLLIAYGAKVDEINGIGETPLVTVILANNSDMVRYLLESGANPNCAECPFGILRVAVSSGRANLCLLLIAYGAKVDEINGIGETPLVTAILANNSDMVRYLLESGANPNCAECPFGILRVAVSSGRANLCLILIAYGAKVDEINGIGETPLVTAILANNSDMVKYILESGADPNCAQCLHHAAWEGRADICRLLFSYGADLNAMNANNETPLMLAIKGASPLS